jgi:NAD(P)-dependent dehydrogenase (short-subunit alcohol dehydrogenase family)
MYPELKGRVAIVTGAGRRGGLGAAIALRLAAEGAKVVVADIGAKAGASAGAHLPASAIGASEEMQAVVAEITAAGGSAIALPCNMLDGAAVDKLVADTVAQLGGVDILVNNAGIGYLMKPIVEMSLDEWDTVLGVNLRGVFAATQAVARRFISQGRGGRIVNIASQAAKSGFPHASSYCASKHGLVGLTRVAAIELAAHKVTVNAVCPNHVTTGLGAWQNEYFAKLLGKSVEQYLADMRSRIPLGRPGLPSDTASAVAFLCSDQAQYITGESMNVSGGEEMH